MTRAQIEELQSAKAQLQAYKTIVANMLNEYTQMQTVAHANLAISTINNQEIAILDDVAQKEICDYLSYVKQQRDELKINQALLNSVNEESGERAIKEQVGIVKTKISSITTRTVPENQSSQAIKNLVELKKGSDICAHASIDKINESSLLVRIR